MKANVILSYYFDLNDLVRSTMAEQHNVKEQYQITASIVNNLANLSLYVLDRVKEKFPEMLITSGYRCKEVNRLVKGAENSLHMKGMAADIFVKDLDALWDFLQNINVDQCIRYPGYIHVSFDFVHNRNQYNQKL